MKRTMMSWMLVATVFATTAAACGSDDEIETPTTEAGGSDVTTADGSDATTAPAGDSANADVDEFCESTDEFAAEYKKVMADPASGDIASLTSRATELTTTAASLSASASADDANRISECLQVMSSAMTGG